MRILIVEDDAEIAELLASALQREGFKPEIAMDGAEGLDKAMLSNFGLILLDIMLPKRDGWAVCSELRRCGVATPIIILSAKDAVPDRIKGLDLGADDYLVKPFDIYELLARIRAVQRRQAEKKSGRIEIGDLVIDSLASTVEVEGQLVHLTPREFSLLEALARHQGQVFTREVILERIWNSDDALPNTVSFHMSSLRRKVDPDSKLIQTVHGFGYVLRLRES